MEWKRVKPLSEDLSLICKRNHVKLPDDFCNIIKEINGAGLIAAHVNVQGIGYVPFSRLLNLDDSAQGNAFQLYESMDDGSKQFFPFGSVGNGDYYCYKMQRAGEYAEEIVLYQHETKAVFTICKSFMEFLDAIEEKS